MELPVLFKHPITYEKLNVMATKYFIYLIRTVKIIATFVHKGMFREQVTKAKQQITNTYKYCIKYNMS